MRWNAISVFVTISIVSVIAMAIGVGIGRRLNTSTSSQLEMVFQPDTLGAEIQYLERTIGPPWKIWGAVRTYKVGECVVSIGTQGTKIDNLRLENISTRCQFDLTRFLHAILNGSSSDPKPSLGSIVGLTFGQFERSMGMGRIRADCLGNCGNSGGGGVYDLWGGYHVEGFLEVQLEADFSSKAAGTAFSAWGHAIEQQTGKDSISTGKYECDTRNEAVAHRLFSDVPIAAITVGYNIPKYLPHC